MRLVQPITGADEVVGGGKVFRGIGNDAAPSIMSCPRFQGAHQPQLQGVAAVLLQHSDPAEISCVEGSRRGNDACEGDRDRPVKSEPPMPLIEFRNGRAVKESQAVEVGERVGDFVVMPVNAAVRFFKP